jgi:quercetin dioxygenase-like cupin family protein
MSAEHHDPVVIAPHIYKVLFENERVRMLEITLKPGDKSAMQYHPDNINYVVAGGKAKVSLPDGSGMEMEVAPCQTVWQPAGSHAMESAGGAEIKVIAVELKG